MRAFEHSTQWGCFLCEARRAPETATGARSASPISRAFVPPCIPPRRFGPRDCLSRTSASREAKPEP